MAASNWQRWYREGTVRVTEDSATVRGTDTYWSSASIKAGDVFSIDGVTDYEVSTVNNDTTITLATNYTGATASGQEYYIHRAFSATTESEVAAQTAALVQDMARYVDTEHATIQGKSAYESAKLNGFVGTEQSWLNSLVGKNAYEVAKASGYTGSQAQWLESLKAAGEWATCNERTAIISEAPASTLHNTFIRGKNLGSHPTKEQYEAIRTGTYNDLWLNDSWNGWRIVGFGYGIGHGGVVHDITTGELRVPVGGKGSTSVNNWFQYIGGCVTLMKVSHPNNGINAGAYYTDEDKNEDGTFVPYYKSNWYRKVRPNFWADAIATFGEEHLYEWKERVPTGFNASGIASGYADYWMRCEMVTHSMITGQQFYTNMGSKAGTFTRDAWANNDYYGQQLPLARLLGPHILNSNVGTWCRDVYGVYNGSLVGMILGNIAVNGNNIETTNVQQSAVIIRIGSTSATSSANIPS